MKKVSHTPTDRFASDAEWSAIIVTPANRERFLRVFNDFSSRRADVNDEADFLRNYLSVDPTPGSAWMLFMDMLHAMDYARRELDGERYVGAEARNYVPSNGSTWLTYITFTQQAVIPENLEHFLRDAVNRENIVVTYVQDPTRWRLAAKVDLPLAGTWAYLLDEAQHSWLDQQRTYVCTLLRDTAPQDGFAALSQWRLAAETIPIPQLLVERFDSFLADSTYDCHTCTLGPG